jgi:Leucine-rich repeat (LRR) protein
MLVGVLLWGHSSQAQSPADRIQAGREFTSLDEALRNPEEVYRLNLSGQTVQLSDSLWSKFTNLQYLSLKNDGLREIPEGIGSLRSLKVLDLSGNDFKELPPTFVNLTNLEELFLNEERNLKLEKSIPILSQLPSLRLLHLENNALKKLPKNVFMLNRIESLYLNKNRFSELPQELKSLKNLNFVDFHDNEPPLPMQELQTERFGIKIGF